MANFLETMKGYAPVSKEVDADPSGHYCTQCGHAQAPKRSSRLHWLINAVLAILLAVSIVFRLQDTEIRAHDTDFGPARHLIQKQKSRFTGQALFHKDGSAYTRPHRDGPQYAGDPSPEIDEAWAALLGNRFFFITESEARDALGENYAKYYKNDDGLYSVELDVIHTLHCVNHLRKALHPDYYPAFGPEDFRKYHIDHCLEILRQSVQCSGDLTLIPTLWWDGINNIFIDSNQVHTCRDIRPIRDWVTERNNGSLAIKPYEMPHGHLQPR